MAARENLAVLAVASVLLVSLVVAWSGRAAAGAQVPDTLLAGLANRRPELVVADALAIRVDVSKPGLRLHPAGQRSAPDAEWFCLPRPRHDALPGLVRTPQRASAARLLRSTTFNPRDLWLPKDGRRAVAAAIAQTDEAVQSLAAALQASGDREFAGLHARGLATPVLIGQYEGVLQLERIGPDPVFRLVAGVTYGVSGVGMPETRKLEGNLHDVGATLVVRLAEAFRAAGALTDAEQQDLAARAQSEVGHRP